VSAVELGGEARAGSARGKELGRCVDVESAATATAEVPALVQITPRDLMCCVSGRRCVVLGITDAFALQGESPKTGMCAPYVEVATFGLVD
jgi:hypothetical protein